MGNSNMLRHSLPISIVSLWSPALKYKKIRDSYTLFVWFQRKEKDIKVNGVKQKVDIYINRLSFLP